VKAGYSLTRLFFPRPPDLMLAKALGIIQGEIAEKSNRGHFWSQIARFCGLRPSLKFCDAHPAKAILRERANVTTINPNIPDELVRDTVAAKILSVTAATLATWRSQGRGPPYYKLGRGVFYHRGDLADFITANRRTPTKAASRSLNPGM
jgi:hypothetical protein